MKPGKIVSTFWKKRYCVWSNRGIPRTFLGTYDPPQINNILEVHEDLFTLQNDSFNPFPFIQVEVSNGL